MIPGERPETHTPAEGGGTRPVVGIRSGGRGCDTRPAPGAHRAGRPTLVLPRPAAVMPHPPDTPGLAWLRAAVARRHASATILGQGTLASGVRWQTHRLTSQRWRGERWSHQLHLLCPAAPASVGGPMLLWVGGGTSDEVAGAVVAEPPRGIGWLAPLVAATGLPAAMVRQVPCQPSCGGLVEDDLVAHSFVEFVRGGRRDWPILLPMTAAVAAAMDAATGLAAGEGFDVAGFVVGGASKRGWASWLAAAADDRVLGLVPTVIDMLALGRHVRLQLETFGGTMSEMLADYTSRGIERLLDTPRGRELVDGVDPWSHRAALRQPKIVALGTNDPYWPLGALDLYRDDLPGTTAVSYAPNAGHGIPGDRLLGLLSALLLEVAGRRPLPALSWSFADDHAGRCARIECDQTPVEIVRWQATADGPDFRLARWTPLPHHDDRGGDDGRWIVPLERASARWSAALVECRFDRSPHPLWLTTSVSVAPPSPLG